MTENEEVDEQEVANNISNIPVTELFSLDNTEPLTAQATAHRSTSTTNPLREEDDPIALSLTDDDSVRIEFNIDKDDLSLPDIGDKIIVCPHCNNANSLGTFNSMSIDENTEMCTHCGFPLESDSLL